MDELIPTRATLIARLKDWRDQTSWQEFFDTYWKLIYSIARKGGLTETEAQDVVQETMVAVAKHIPSFQYDPAIGSFKAWLLNMTRWRITDQLRKRGPLVRRDMSQIDEPLSEDASQQDRLLEKGFDQNGEPFEKLWNDEWEKNIFDAAVLRIKRRVDPQKYQIFDFYVNKEWEPAKIAGRFDVSVDQVYLIKHRITELIKAEVKRLEDRML